MNKVFRLLAAAVFAVLSLSGVALAQTAATGNIEGVVTDTTGAVLPGVSVIVKNTGTNATRELVTDDGGRYRATALQPGLRNHRVARRFLVRDHWKSPGACWPDTRRRSQDARGRRDRDHHRHGGIAAP